MVLLGSTEVEMANGKKSNGDQTCFPSFSGYDPVSVTDFVKSNGTVSADHQTDPGGPSMTRQEFAEDCDINAIMKRYENSGASINGLNRHPDLPPLYVDFAAMPSTLMEYQSFMGLAAQSFMSLPAAVRKQFDNDPVAFCDYAADPANLDQMREWKLAPPAAPAQPPIVGPVPAAPPAPSAPPAAPSS